MIVDQGYPSIRNVNNELVQCLSRNDLGLTIVRRVILPYNTLHEQRRKKLELHDQCVSQCDALIRMKVLCL